MKTQTEMVREFHDKFGVGKPQRISDAPERAIVDTFLKELAERLHDCTTVVDGMILANPDDQRLARMHHELEELAEQAHGMGSRDELAVLDALADRLYILRGSAIVFDLPLDSAFSEVHDSNMTKEMRQDRPGHPGKGESYRPPDLESMLKAHRARASKAGRELSPWRRLIDKQREERRLAAAMLNATEEVPNGT